MYRIAAPAREKTGDGVALCFRAGLELRDMEMLQFHPTGLVAGASRLTGAVLEEGLRGAGAHLYNAHGERFMARYDAVRLERSTRDVVARAAYTEIVEGRGTPEGGVLLDITHLGVDEIDRRFGQMRARTQLIGSDLATGPVQVSPTAHFHMGGVVIDIDCTTSSGLLVAGEDAGGTHGANRLGGNGVAESTVFGVRAGKAAAATAARGCTSPIRIRRSVDRARVRAADHEGRAVRGDRPAEGRDVAVLRPRAHPHGLLRARELLGELGEEATRVPCPARDRRIRPGRKPWTCATRSRSRARCRVGAHPQGVSRIALPHRLPRPRRRGWLRAVVVRSLVCDFEKCNELESHAAGRADPAHAGRPRCCADMSALQLVFLLPHYAARSHLAFTAVTVRAALAERHDGARSLARADRPRERA